MNLEAKRQDTISHSLKSVSLERVKEHLRILDNDEDYLIQMYIEAATASLEKWTGYDMLVAEYIAYFDCCNNCRPGYILSGRPFKSIEKIEVWQNGQYVSLLTGYIKWQSGGVDLYSGGVQLVSTDTEAGDDVNYDFCVDVRTWETIVTISNDIQIDQDCECNDPVKITYKTGKVKYLGVDKIETTTVSGDSPQVAIVTTELDHCLKTNDQVTISGTTEENYNDMFTVTVLSQNTFSIEYTGEPSETVFTGLCAIPDIPPQLQLSVMQMAGMMTENRGDCSDACGSIPCMVQTLAGQFRRYRFLGAGGVNCCGC